MSDSAPTPSAMAAPGAAPIAVTGAAGFLGAAVLDAAAEAGVPVRAILRRGSTLPSGDRPGVESIGCGLADRDALVSALRGCRAVVHAALPAPGSPDASGVEDALGVLVAEQRTGGEPAPALVLVSSFSVYGYQRRSPGDALDERTPDLDAEGERGRDGYAHEKRLQEVAASELADDGGSVVALRPGVIVGPGRRWTARLGVRKGPLAVRVGRDGPVPLIGVAACGRACVRAALWEPEPGFRAFNLVEDETPTQAAYLRRVAAEEGIRRVVPLPAGLVRVAGRVLFPLAGDRLPTLLRPAAFDARFKPLRFPNDKARAAGLL